MKRASSLRGAPLDMALGALLLFPFSFHADNRPMPTLQDVLVRHRKAIAPLPGQAAVTPQRIDGTTEFGGRQGIYVSFC